MAEDTPIKRALRNAGMAALSQKFEEERIELSMIITMTDGEMTRLGVGTIGERIKLRESAKQVSFIIYCH